MKQMEFIRAGILWLILLAFMSLTRPYTLPVSVLIVPFIVSGLALFMSWRAMTGLYYKNKQGKYDARRVNLLGAIVSAVLVFALGLESLGELTPKDFFVIVLFGAVAYFYMVRSTREK